MFFAGFDLLFSILFPILFLVVLGMILYAIIGYVRRPQAARSILPMILEASLCAADPVRGSRALRHNFC